VDQFTHLLQPQRIEREKNRIQYERWIYAAKKPLNNEKRVAGHTDDSQRNHRFHRAGNDARRYGRVAEPHGPFGMLDEFHIRPALI
jgi:hypothetical protein